MIHVALLLLGVYFLRPTLRAFQSWTAHVAGWGSVSSARHTLYEHLQKLSPKYYSDNQTGQIMSRVVNDTNHFEVLMAHAVPEMTVSFLTVIGVFSVVSY